MEKLHPFYGWITSPLFGGFQLPYFAFKLNGQTKGGSHNIGQSFRELMPLKIENLFSNSTWLRTGLLSALGCRRPSELES